MADIELVIKIPEEIYQVIKKGYTMLGGRSSKTISSILFAAVVNSIPLPKGHGRLIDADKYRKDMQNSREFNFFATLDFQQTIINADESEK